MTDAQDPADRLAVLEADNARLRRLLDGAGAPDALRHGLRDTVAMLRAMLRQSAETAEDLEGYVAHLEGRLGAVARVRAGVDMFGEADLHSLISDELLLHLVREGERASIGGPAVLLRPKPAQVVALAVHELATNAIEHGSLHGSDGRVDVAWSADADAVTLVWKETGGEGVAPPARRGFGTRVLEEMLTYDLKAGTRLAYEPDGLRCTIRLPLDGRIGRLGDARAPDADEAPSHAGPG